MIDIMFSIPVHEKWECVLDQIINILHFNPNSAIVLHISQMFDNKENKLSKNEFENALRKIGRLVSGEGWEYANTVVEGGVVYINPVSVRTRNYDIIQAHLYNYLAVRNVNFEYFVMCASNELFIKSGLYEKISGYDCVFDVHNDIELNSKWVAGRFAKNDEALKNILSELNATKIMGSQIEGTCYKKELFGTMTDLILKHYDYLKMQEVYAREEVYFSTIAYALAQQEGLNVYDSGMFTWVPWDRLYNMCMARTFDIKRLIKKNGKYFAIKRVARNINDCVRAYVRQTAGYEDVENNVLKEKIIRHYPLIIIYLREPIKEIKAYNRNFKKLINRYVKDRKRK